MITSSLGTNERNRVFLTDLSKSDVPGCERITEFKAAWDFIDARGSALGKR